MFAIRRCLRGMGGRTGGGKRRGIFSGEIRNNLSAGVPHLGEFAECTHAFEQADVNTFAGICGDDNPLHTNPEFARSTIFKAPIVHGILVSSLFSTLFGGTTQGSIYVSQDLKFKAPVFVGSPVTARMEVVQSDSKRKGVLLTCSTTCVLEDGTLAVDGHARVLVPHPAAKE